ncbi:hypothetical protein ACMAZF_10640 [Psychrobium sp. nBUS_13]|uniref:hypothetical protein n=1 Tax=Psychrobium sp. nBUS_13 TaxID=3395319 RepID=UPI003EBC6500
MKRKNKTLIFLMATLATFSVTAQNDVVIDGTIDSIEWQGAQIFDDFKLSYPNTGDKPKYPTTTYLKTDDKGIYIAFKNFQPERSRKYSGHDHRTSADFIPI